MESIVRAAFLVTIVSSAAACPRPPPPPTAETDADEIITAFKQGDEGNCTSIGFIKAMLLHTRADPSAEGMLAAIFPSHSLSDGGAKVTTHAGVTLSVTAEEIRRAGDAADLVLLREHDPRAITDLANGKLLFAIMAKACETDCRAGGDLCSAGEPDRVCSFDRGIEDLDRSLTWNVPPSLLGLREGTDWRPIRGWKGGRWSRVTRFVRGGHACVAATRGHTFFVGDGWADKYGRPVAFNSKFGSWFAFKAAQAYCLGSIEATVERQQEQAAPPPQVASDPDLADIE